MLKNKKYIFITGGVCSSLGKGITASTIGALMEGYGFKISMLKIDPYLNVDAGTMSPLQHGETYVTEDGFETDLDLGNYERFTDYILSKKNSITTGQIYSEVIFKERKGSYLGKCVQVIPHITDEIKKRIYGVINKNEDILIVEIGGTIGDIESWVYLEAIRQLRNELTNNETALVHLSLVPKLWGGEFKTKLTQHSVQKLREIGLQPDLLICRVEKYFPDEVREKISLFTSVKPQYVIEAPNLSSIYKAPMEFKKNGLGKNLLYKLDLKPIKQNFDKWVNLNDKIDNINKQIKIAIIGKYTNLEDSYKSIYQALIHAGFSNNCKIDISPIDSKSLNEYNINEILSKSNGILIPGGFGSSGIEGKILGCKYARENKIPFLGICLGMQIMLIEFARNILNLKNANSTEFDLNTKDPVVYLIEEQKNNKKKGGTMRLGSFRSEIIKNTKLSSIYDNKFLKERHRHRYEVNNIYLKSYEKKGLIVSSIYKEKNLIEAIEWKNSKFGIGVQFHPEFKSKPFRVHPLFDNFIKNILDIHNEIRHC